MISNRSLDPRQLPPARAGSASVAPKFVVLGDLWVAPEPGQISTVLGSCVAVCLWERVRRVGGMNHYLRPSARQSDTSYLGGNIAIAALVDRMAAHGCRRRNLVAKVFGGSHSPHSGWNLGAENVLIAWSELRREGIAIIASDVGGSHGRGLTFDVASGQVQLRRLDAGGRP